MYSCHLIVFLFAMADPSKVILLTFKPEKAVGIGSKSLRYTSPLTKVLKMYFKVNCMGAAPADLFDLRYTFLCVSLWMKISYTNLEVVKYK